MTQGDLDLIMQAKAFASLPIEYCNLKTQFTFCEGNIFFTNPDLAPLVFKHKDMSFAEVKPQEGIL